MTANRDKPANKQTKRTNRQKSFPPLCDLLTPAGSPFDFGQDPKTPKPMANARQQFFFFAFSCNTKLDKYTSPKPPFGLPRLPLLVWQSQMVASFGLLSAVLLSKRF